MAAQCQDFPFNIMDVAALLRLNIRRRGADQVYVDCPICGDRRGKMNLNLIKNVWRCNYCQEYGGMLALYAKVYGISNSDAYREICDALQAGDFAPEYKPAGKTAPQAAPQSERASVQAIHQTLSMLFSMLSLLPEHRAHLQRKRGLTDEQIDAFGFRSTPPPYLCRSLTARLLKQGCQVQGVPGFYVDDAGQWTVKFHKRTAGIIIPILGVDGLIRGAQIRLDQPIKDKDDPPDKDGTKYLWLASTGKNMGTTSGSPVHFIGNPCSRVVYVTEGGLKAYVSHALMNRTFAATAGANNVAQLEPLFSLLSKSGTEEIIECEDMDKYRNDMVDKGASKIYLMAKKFGMSCWRLTWNPNYKGIDDWQLALRQKKKEKKGAQSMNFKQQYLLGQCDIKHIEDCTAQWHQMQEDGTTLADYLGLTPQEYALFAQEGLAGSFKMLLDGQRRQQRFRVYQLDLSEGKTRPFAFAGIDALHKAGFQQPPSSEYCMVYAGELICPSKYLARDVLEIIFDRYNDCLPKDYAGRSISLSDVVELYNDDQRLYYYCDTAGFIPVKFSPFLARSAPKRAAEETPPTEGIDGERLGTLVRPDGPDDDTDG